MGRKLLRDERRESTSGLGIELDPNSAETRLQRFRWQNYRERMTAFYRDYAERLLVNYNVLQTEPENSTAAPVSDQPAAPSGVPGPKFAQRSLTSEDRALQVDLNEAKRDLEVRYNRLDRMRLGYGSWLGKALETHRHMTQEEFAHKWLTTVLADFNDDIAQGRKRVKALTERARNAGLLKRPGQAEDHPEDGHVSSASTEFEEQCTVGKAKDTRQIGSWLWDLVVARQARISRIMSGASVPGPTATAPGDIQPPGWEEVIRPSDSFSHFEVPEDDREQIDGWHEQMNAEYAVSRETRLAKLSALGWPVVDQEFDELQSPPKPLVVSHALRSNKKP